MWTLRYVISFGSFWKKSLPNPASQQTFLSKSVRRQIQSKFLKIVKYLKFFEKKRNII